MALFAVIADNNSRWDCEVRKPTRQMIIFSSLPVPEQEHGINGDECWCNL